MNIVAPDPALTTAPPVAMEQPISIPATASRSRNCFSDTIIGMLYYGMLASDIGFPVVATTYAILVY